MTLPEWRLSAKTLRNSVGKGLPDDHSATGTRGPSLEALVDLVPGLHRVCALLFIDYAQKQEVVPPADGQAFAEPETAPTIAPGSPDNASHAPASIEKTADARSGAVPVASPATTTGDSQIDAFLGDEMRRWQEDFGFDDDALHAGIRRAIHAFRPFLLFNGGREAITEVCRDAHEEAGRTQRRLGRVTRPLGRAGGEEATRSGAFAFSAIEAAASDWLQDKTLANVDPQLPEGGWFAAEPGSASRSPDGAEMLPKLRASRGNLVNAAGKIVWAARPDLPLTVNASWRPRFWNGSTSFSFPKRTFPASRARCWDGCSSCRPDRAACRRRARPASSPAKRASSGCTKLATRLGPSFAAPAGSTSRTSCGSPQKLPARRRPPKPAGNSRARSRSSASNRPSSFGNGLIAVGVRRSPATIGPRCSPRPLTRRPPSCAAWWADGLKLPAELTNSIGMKLVLIPAGEFFMGSTPLEIGQVRRADPDV